MPNIIVKAKSERGFRRAGLQFTRAGVALDTATLSDEQLKAIESEPHLVVTVVEPEKTHEQRVARDKKEADAAAAAEKDALARETKARKGAGQAAWDAASVIAAGTAELTPEQFAALAPSDRVARIEAVIAEGSK